MQMYPFNDDVHDAQFLTFSSTVFMIVRVTFMK